MESFWLIDLHGRLSNMAKNKKGIIGTDMVEKALRIAFDVHKAQLDEAGRPFILHPLHVAEQMKGETAVCAALLHDVVKDDETIFDSLSSEGISDEVIEVLKILTPTPSSAYLEHIKSIKESENYIAIQIALEELLHILSISKLDSADEEITHRFFLRMDAMAILESEGWQDGDLQYIHHAVTTRTLDIKSSAPSIGGRLSNLTKRTFVFDGVPCESIEGALQSFKFPDPDRQKEVCSLYGFTAKKAGQYQDWKSSQTLYWQGVAYPRNSDEYQRLLDRLYLAAFEQNEIFREDLCVKAKGYKLLHSTGVEDPCETILTEVEFISRLERLRESRICREAISANTEEHDG